MGFYPLSEGYPIFENLNQLFENSGFSGMARILLDHKRQHEKAAISGAASRFAGRKPMAILISGIPA
jgi:hypothetical protein